MSSLIFIFIFLLGLFSCDSAYGGGYEASYSGQDMEQADVQAPAYIPAYMKNQKFTRPGYREPYSGTKNGYGTKSGYGGTKTSYTGTKTWSSNSGLPQADVQAPAYVPAYMPEFTKTGFRKTYSGTKTGYGGTKTGYAGTKTGYGTKSGYGGTKTSYTGTKSWSSNSGLPANYQEFQKNANRPYQPLCEPECQNNGICVDTNTCDCAANFHGDHCQFEKKPCLTYPPLPMNSHRKCSSELCTITCVEGHKFFDGSTVANMRCVGGQWQPSRADITSLTDCVPECDPPCLNGGACLSLNTCQCSQDYRGPQCQYAATACDVRKLSFNGGYNCFGDGEQFSCKLTCPSGASFSTPPAEVYTCLYATGTFEPQPIPHCMFNEVVVITPSNYHHTGFNKTYYETTYDNQTSHFSSHSHTKQAGEPDIESETTNTASSYSHGNVKTPVQVVVQDLTPKDGVCLTWAGAHYKTFDGKIYSFLSPCQHILVRDTKDHKFTVTVRHGECKRQYYCPSELSIYLEDKEYVLAVAEDGSVIFRSSRRLIPVPASLPGISVTQPGDSVIVSLPAATVKWDTNNLVTIEASLVLWNNTEGLCGNLDGSALTDFKTRDGSIASTKSAFVASWQVNKIGDTCDSSPSQVNACASTADEDMKRAQQFCLNIFSKDKFRRCSAVMDVSMLLETCQWDYCACTTSLSAEECACKTVAVYAKECLRHGVAEMKLWRDSDTCPMHCPEGKIYKSCGPDSQPSCSFPMISSTIDNSSCVEGCFCPEGLLLEAGRCVPKSECPCRLRNKSFPPGATVAKDCNTCTCQAGAWTCTAVPCGARCGAVGDPHYTTFDGLRYDFMGHCSYTLLETQNLTVQVENVACSGSISEAMNLSPFKGEGKPSCTKSVSLDYGGASVHMKQGGYILVNGKEIEKLPVRVGQMLIRAASSLFVIVQLPIGVDIWWDGNTRVFVDVPAEFHDKTKGLCGTFNLNQKDDFLTPEGDVEQNALSFANKWKTREFCTDVDIKEPEHPCKANVENKEVAEKYCSKLKSKLFEACHWHVDVEPYYESCVYDMCACAGDAARCLCPIVGDYAMACAKQGVMVQWRYNVKECELQCTGGQEYTVCADSCLRTCSDLSLLSTSKCKPICVEGCACPPGQVLDASSSCVPVAMCPCVHKGMEFKPGYKEVRPGRRERELCTCVGARWDCVPATPEQIQNYPPAEDLMHNCTATQHMEFTTCETAEPLTCKNMHLPPTTTTSECRPGCQCKKGYVMDVTSKKCVLPSECPCHHGGRSYPDGHTMTEECNTCECKSGTWSCTKRKCVGVCTAWGDSHITTFDGTDYDFEGVCTYLLAKGCMEAGKDGFDVEIQNVPCGTTGATCSKSVTLRVGSGGTSEEIVSLTKNSPIPDISKLKRIKMRMAGVFVFLDVPSLGMSLQWDRAMRVYVKVDAMWQNRVKGLCGNYNSDMRDDFQTPSSGGIAESSALIFADSWKLKTTCPKPLAVRDHCQQRPERKEWALTTCGAMKRYPFTLCHSEVPPSGFVERCERDACACDSGDDCECACAALAAYAQLCASRGVPFKWRTKEMCPMQCDEECSNYDACISPCPVENCDNTLNYEQVLTSCEKDSCVEGCKPKNSTCPEGQVFSNSSQTECVPRAKCKPVCMTTKEGKEVLEGEVLEEDACHTCRCSKGEKICTGQPCPTEMPTPAPVESSPTPHDEPLKCVTGWAPWISRNTPETNSNGESVDTEPLPQPKDLQIGSPMCKPEMMKKIECRTVTDHLLPKETGLNVECSLEKGLVCKENDGRACPDFEIRVYCQCGEEPFQCLDSTHPSYPHPSECNKFYECTPDLMNPDKPHAVLKSCGEGMMYNPTVMVCDWPASVIAVRPDCRNDTKEARELLTTVSPTTATWATVPSSTSSLCPPGQVHKDCAYPCDKLCDHFKKSLIAKGECKNGEKCVSGCVEESVANIKCEVGSLWRDTQTCVPLKDCTCYSNDGKFVKPGGVVSEGCLKCQCLDNAFHCDSTECVSVIIPMSGSSHQPLFSTPAQVKETTVTTTTELPTTKPPTATTEATTILLVKSTVHPPPQCTEDRFIKLLWDSEILSDLTFTASSTANALFAPEYAVLNGHPMDITAGSWNPATQDDQQYIQVEFPQRTAIYGVMMQGSPLFDQYVTSYELMYGDDGHVFSTVTTPQGENKVFRGPIDHNNPVKQMIEPPIEAKFIRIHPLTWHDEIAVRFELIGCEEPATTTATTPTTTTPTTRMMTTVTTVSSYPQLVREEQVKRILLDPEPIQCVDLLGLSAGLPIDNIEVSSNNDARQYFSLDGERGWTPLYSTPGEWIMFDFTSPRNITGIKTKGGPNGWVTSYTIMYTSDLTRFNPVVDEEGVMKVFPANFDRESVVVNEFRPPIHARYFKVLPMKWNDHIEMRIEPVGCYEPYPTPAPIIVTSTTPTIDEEECNACPGAILPSNHECTCLPNQYYDGENCVTRDQCPCFEGFISYAVGSTFRGANCDECVCKLGGTIDCKPVKECTCNPDLVPKLDVLTCDCACEPCPNGTKLCPTSKVCLSLDKWCDGLQDCPDDERECTTSTRAPSTTTTIEPTAVTTVRPTVQQTVATTVAPILECPKVDCPPGYIVQYTSTKQSYSKFANTDLPPPRPRLTYQRYYKGGFAKGGRGGYAKGGYSKGGFSKGGFSGIPAPPKANQAFTLDKPSSLKNLKSQVQECQQFKCVPKLPPFKPGVVPKPVVCSAPHCPPKYSLKLEAVAHEKNKCPQYACVPPVDRPVFCNVTGRTFNTFDGSEYKYDVCFHILARDNRFDAWTVLVRKKCRVDGCLNELLVRQDDQLILVKPNLMIEYDNYEYTVEQTSMICFQKNSFDLDRLGNGLVIKSRKYNFTVIFNMDGDVKVGVSKSYMGSVDGLCGYFDGDRFNDRRLPDGRQAVSVDKFGRAWAKPGLSPHACQTKVIPAEKQKKAWDLCDVVTKEPLSRCGKVLNLDKWRNICLEKICECADLVVNGTKRTDEQCRCLLLEQFIAECLAADRDVDLSDWRMQMDCPAECPAPLVHYDCYRRSCEPQCSLLGTVSKPCVLEDGQCTPGCYCPEGRLRRGPLCVQPAQCTDCVCNNVGTKYVTFEKDDLPFGGNCTYLASRDRNETGHHKYQVYATNGPCDNNNALTCTKLVHLIYEKKVVRIEQNPSTKKLVVTVDGTVVYKYPVKKDWITVELVNSQDVNILLHEAHIELSVSQSEMEFSVKVPSYLYANATEGLCGVCAGYQEHLTMSNGTATDDLEKYGKSWQAKGDVLTTLGMPDQQQCDEPPPKQEECVPPPPEQNPCYNIYNAEKFGACHALVDPQSYVESCEAELCATNVTDICSVLERYVAECRKQGVCLKWRTELLCPRICELPLVYRPCVACELTCDNYEEMKDGCDKNLVEGCYCPEGKVRVNNTCIEPAKCFPCDANKEHYAGDEWQEDACTKCSCSKVVDENSAHVACTTQSCTAPVCSDSEDMITKPATPGACCLDYACVPKPQDTPHCEEPKKIECGFGQVLKQKTKPDGCMEFACECKPASECSPLPSANDVELLQPGMARVVDNSGCCPKVEMICRRDTCPTSPACPQFHDLKVNNVTGACCPEYSCELPKDKCVVTLEWEAASKGGETPRASPEVMLKYLDEAWLDGPCRSCRCEASPLGASPHCAVTSCPAVTSDAQFVVEPRPVPFQCCPVAEQVACRDRDNIYKVGEKWTSESNVCESYECVLAEDGKLDRVTHVQTCDSNCQQGSQYFPAEPSSGICCGKCKPVACVCSGIERKIGEKWTSPDFCTNYTCVDVNGNLQVQTSNESCPEVPKELKKQFQIKEEKIPEKCCKTQEPVACKVGDKIYQEGETWQSTDPCVNVTCARDSVGRLTFLESTETCKRDCQLGWEYVRPEDGVCCGHCAQTACVVDGEVKPAGTTWHSDDNCTTFSCDRNGDVILVTSSHVTCPGIEGCAPEDLVNETCCRVCREKPQSLKPKTCKPESLADTESVGIIRLRLGVHGLCINKRPVPEFKECRGSCNSGTLYNNHTGSHDSKCECCQAIKYSPVTITLNCEDGSTQQHRVASPAKCDCRECGGGVASWPSSGHSTVKSPSKTRYPAKTGYVERQEVEIPDMYRRFGEETTPPDRR